MSALDTPLRALSKTLTKTLGKQGTIEYVTTGGYNPSTGKASYGEAPSSDVYGVVEHYSTREIDGTTVKRGDIKWTIHAKDVDLPRVNDLVDFGDTDADGNRLRWAIVGVRDHYSGDDVALHELQLRR